jgi:hypothetical protein
MSANEITGVKKQPTDADKQGNRGKASAKGGGGENRKGMNGHETMEASAKAERRIPVTPAAARQR